MLKASTYRWKGKIVSKKTYNQRLAQYQSGKNRRQVPIAAYSEVDIQEPEAENNTEDHVADKEPYFMDGRRIVELKVLGQQLWCVSCKEVLSLENIENEIRQGLASLLTIRCHKCLLLNKVATGKQRETLDKRSARFDINSKAVLGILHSGSGWTSFTKLCSCMNIPSFEFKTFKKYEREVGLAAEAVAKKSCENATDLERELTIKHADDIEKLLPEEFRSNFIIRHRSSSDSTLEHSSIEEGLRNTPVTFDDVIRILISYDMGWSTRGAGRNYDSLNGFGAAIGAMSGLVLDYSTRNRKCKKCDQNDVAPEHDCRKNFYGSAKAMEPDVAKALVVESSILKSQNVQVGVLIGDDDSSTIAACRAASNHPIIKQSDINHASGGVKKELYNIQKRHTEMTKDSILYLHRCFTYSVAQNKGNSKAISNAIECIPYHAFNDHSKCGAWCGYVKDKENYDHRIIPGGFHNKNLFEDLKKIFHLLAANALKFSSGASSNANESLNATMASKAPKSRCYSMTASSDYRFACAVGQKNIGEGYTEEIAKAISLSPGRHHSRHVSRVQKTVQKRRALIKTAAFKKQRMELRKLRTSLRHRKENYEGVTYKSNCALLNEPAVEKKDDEAEWGYINDEFDIVLLDLETSGFERHCDILQITAKCGNQSFESYINPTQKVSHSATLANGLINCHGDLMHHGIKVPSVPLRVALGYLKMWLSSFSKKCVIAVHNLSFDGPKFFRAINRCTLVDEFSEVLYGFIDTLEVIRRVTNRKGRGQCTISGLADFLHISTTGAHNVIHDCNILEKILHKANISNEELIKNVKTFDDQISHWAAADKANDVLITLIPLQKVVGSSIRKKLAMADITIDILLNVYKTSGASGITQLFQKEKPKVILKGLRKTTIQRIVDFCQNLNDKNDL